MRTREIIFTPEAEDDLDHIYNQISERASPRIAFAFVSRIEAFCRSLTHAAERGTDRSDVSPGMRSLGFERRVTIVLHVEDTTASVVRIFPAGRNWIEEFAQDG